jgi:hypothetical protein
MFTARAGPAFKFGGEYVRFRVIFSLGSVIVEVFQTDPNSIQYDKRI